jgi:hypothetical protein
MAIDLGDPYPLAVFITDDSGNPANATTVVVTVTLPDLTVATPAVTNATTGTYTASYPTTQAGHHDVGWVATGLNACAYEDAFDVAVPERLIISLADARAALGKPAGDTVKDEDLRLYIMAATPIMENIIGPILQQTQDQWYDGGSPIIMLTKTPVISVTSVTETFGANVIRTLIYQPLDGITPVDAFGYTLDSKSGALIRRVSGVAAPFAAGRRNVHVISQVGRVLTANQVLATRLVVRQLWLVSGQQGLRPSMGTPGSAPSAPTGFAVPNAVYELCAPDASVWGIA